MKKRLSVGEIRIVFMVILSLFYVSSFSNAFAESAEVYKQLNLFGDVFARVKEFYVEKVPDDKLVEKALNGMLTSLDPHSSYMSEKEFKELKDMAKGEFGGLGIEVTMEHGVIKIISPIEDAPAYKAGLMSGDYIVEVDDTPIVGQSLNEAVEKMRGKPGEPVNLKIVREGEKPFDVKVVREIIKVRPVRWRIEDNIGYIRITTLLNENAGKNLLTAVKEIKSKLGDKLEGFILDLRNNAGGLLEQALEVSDLFLDQKEIVSTKGRDGKNTKRFMSRAGDVAKDIPIVVLINSGSASASEIVAGALRDQNRALLLGIRSFGKGSVQTVMPIKGKGAIRLTTDLYYTPSGVSIQAEGITPDVVVEQSTVEVIEKDHFREEKIPGALRGIIVAERKRLKEEKKNGKDKDDKKKEEVKAKEKKAKSVLPSKTDAQTSKAATNPRLGDSEVDYQFTRAMDVIHAAAKFKNITTKAQ
ncbi:MAG: S41 family peptidase [Alphaproteobacteria bacterium]|jgi:carboxyl-terminal processing protease|nr:S41 family peptidase [Alphaproteobacteria bacterium]MBT5389623.1 S41 family peptidase [Alphaproteobacteria bacterium]MBT5654571.1 S41 family peptidase [Alphaproteobacteria bacterium]